MTVNHLYHGCRDYSTKGHVAVGSFSKKASKQSLIEHLSGDSDQLIKWVKSG